MPKSQKSKEKVSRRSRSRNGSRNELQAKPQNNNKKAYNYDEYVKELKANNVHIEERGKPKENRRARVSSVGVRDKDTSYQQMYGGNYRPAWWG